MSGVPLICYDLPTVSRFFRSVALSMAFQRHTSIEWVPYRDSAVLNAIYTVLFWKEGPGNAEIKQGSGAAIMQTTDELHERFLAAWVDKVFQGGPTAGNTYVNLMAGLRDDARQSVANVFREAQQINAAVINQTQDAIVTLARIKLAATVGVAVIGGAAGVAFALGAAGAGAAGGVTVLGLQAGTSAAGFGLTGLGYSVTNNIIKTWEQGPAAKVAAVSVDVGKYAASETGGHLAGQAVERAVTQQGRSAQIIKSAEGQVRKYSEKLAQEGLRRAQARKATNIVQQSQRQIAREGANMAKAGNMAKLARGTGAGIPVLFAAWDIIDAWGDYQDTMKTVR